MLREATITALTVLLPCTALAKESARDIIKKSQDVQRLEATTQTKLVAIDSKGKKRQRKMEGKAKKNEKGLWWTYSKVTAPPDLSGTQFLVQENKGAKENTLYLYQPVNKRVRSVSAAQRKGRYVGTDLFYEDMDVYDVDEDTHKLLREEKLTLKVGKSKDTVDCWVIESTPKPEKSTSYSKSVVWIQKSNYYPRQTEMYRDGKKIKRWQAFIVQQKEGKWFTKISQMEDLKEKSKTIIQTLKVDFDKSKLPDKIFTKSYLLTGG